MSKLEDGTPKETMNYYVITRILCIVHIGNFSTAEEAEKAKSLWEEKNNYKDLSLGLIDDFGFKAMYDSILDVNSKVAQNPPKMSHLDAMQLIGKEVSVHRYSSKKPFEGKVTEVICDVDTGIKFLVENESGKKVNLSDFDIVENITF